MTTRPQDGVCAFVARSDDELRAYLDAEIAKARRGPAPVRLETGDDDDELVEATPASAPRRSKARTPSLTKALREAKKAGIPVAGALLTADGSVSLSFGEAVKTNGNELDEWMKHAYPAKGN
jgi:hypothetical protein